MRHVQRVSAHDQREPVRIGIQTGAEQTAQAHRPLQRPSGIPGHAVTPVGEINIETLQKRMRSRLPGVARLLREPTRCGPSREPLPHDALRRSARRPNRPRAQDGKRRPDPTMRARQRATPVVQLVRSMRINGRIPIHFST